MAVLVWCAAAWHLKARDEAVGWDAVTRSQRLKLVVQLRRFLVLEATRRPNLASQCLGAGLRALVGQWEGQHGYRPLLAESFSDPESRAGTVCKATNWLQAGLTKGYSQDHTDFYVPNGRPNGRKQPTHSFSAHSASRTNYARFQVCGKLLRHNLVQEELRAGGGGSRCRAS